VAIIDWKIEREKGFSQITFEIKGEPIISLENYLKLVKALIFEANRDDVSVILLTGPREKFFFGMDIREIGALKTTIATRGSSAAGQDLLNELEASPASLICAVDGTCFGGGLELAMVFHIIFATPSSSFGLPEIKVGTIPSFGGTQRLPRIVGRNRALRVMLTGETFSAQTAKEWGLVTEVIPREDLIPTAQKLGRRVAALSRHAVKALLCAAIKGLDASLMSGLALESFNSSQLAGGQDLEEGIKAFFEKRSPLFPSTLKG
jgi:enoyl-CoA hydratase